MATVKMTLREAIRGGGRVNREVLDATTDEDIRRHAVEDGQDPDAVHDDWYPSPAALRERLHLTQTVISRRLRIPVATWRNWEQGRVTPDPAARALLTILWRHPQVIEPHRVGDAVGIGEVETVAVSDTPVEPRIRTRRVRGAASKH